ncbi:unnamed protein product [Linum trigynum]|uniref:Uncharacterized protein n=1 Tax=Linum trigynum TaxID=586398 RepID=A0AAV2EXU3_9ROSI
MINHPKSPPATLRFQSPLRATFGHLLPPRGPHPGSPPATLRFQSPPQGHFRSPLAIPRSTIPGHLGHPRVTPATLGVHNPGHLDHPEITHATARVNHSWLGLQMSRAEPSFTSA